MVSLAPSLAVEYHTSEDTEATFKNKINDKGFCVTHPDFQVRVKKTFGKDVITHCPKCQATFDLELENKKKNEKLERAKAKAVCEKEHGIELRLSEDEVTNSDHSNPMHRQQQLQPQYSQQQQQQPQYSQQQQQPQYLQQQQQPQYLQQQQQQPQYLQQQQQQPQYSQQQQQPQKVNFSSSCFDICEDPIVCLLVGIPCCFPIAVLSYASMIGITDTHGICGIVTSVVSTVCYPCGLIACPHRMLPCFATSLVKRAMVKHNISKPPPPLGDAGFCGCWFQVCLCAPCMLCMLLREQRKFPYEMK